MLYVLDVDDTLYLERDFVKSGFRAVDAWLKKNCEVNHFFEVAWRLFEEGTRGNIFNLALAQTMEMDKGSDSIIEQLVTVYRSHEPDISLLPDALAFFVSRDVSSLAIITDGYSHVQWAKIKALQLDRMVGKIIVTGDWGQTFWKPHPRAFIKISQGYETKECVYIADNPKKDFFAPQKLSWRPSIRIRRKGSLHYHLDSPEDCKEISSLGEIDF